MAEMGRQKGRAANRRAVETAFGLDADADPLFVVISRLTWQKGIDLLAECAPGLVAAGAKLAVLGTGDAALEGRFLALAAAHRGRIAVNVGYNEALAHLIAVSREIASIERFTGRVEPDVVT